MTLLLHLVLLLARHRWWWLAVCGLAALLAPAGSRRRGLAARLLILGLGLGGFLGGPLLGGWWLSRVGDPGTAQVVGTYRTFININDRDVVGYRVLIRDARGAVFPSRFEDDEVNVFPPADVSYPRPGETFGVRFLPAFPRDFILLADAPSPWTRRVRCDALSLKLSEAGQGFEFGRGAPPLRQPYAQAIDAYLAAGCAGAEPGPASFRADSARALAGEPLPAP